MTTAHRYTRALFAMSRPAQIVSVWVVALTGVFIAQANGYTTTTAHALYAFAVLTLVSMSIHYANEYADYETDQITVPTPYSGGSGAVGLIRRSHTLLAAWVTLTLGLGAASVGLTFGLMNLATILILLVGAFFGWMYSLPPLQLGWRGWGELDNALLGGLLLPLFGYASVSNSISPTVMLISIPFVALDFTNLLATTYADRKADAQVGKYTLATKFSSEQLRLLYSAICLIFVGSFTVLAWVGQIPAEVSIFYLPVMPMVAWAWLRYTRTDAPHASVNAMVALMLAQAIGWGLLALGFSS